MNQLKHYFLFGKQNYIILIAGLLILGISFVMMSGGGSQDPNVFSSEIFSTGRITVAPVLALIGYVVVIAAILYKPKDSGESK